VVALAACGDGSGLPDPPTPDGPVDLSAEWITSSPSAQGVDPGPLSSALIYGASNIPGLTSVVVVRNGRLVAERYLRRGGADSLYALRSVTKSVISLLIGLAIERGEVAATSQTLSELFVSPLPTLDAAHGAVIIGDLLTMRSGIEWNESSVAEYNGWVLAPDQINYLLARDVIEPPGTRWNYNSAAVHLLSAGRGSTSVRATWPRSTNWGRSTTGISGGWGGPAGATWCSHGAMVASTSTSSRHWRWSS
jgi:CubicO group peptidase (beta-lactamase class C family)